jgi:hypothetical protein
MEGVGNEMGDLDHSFHSFDDARVNLVFKWTGLPGARKGGLKFLQLLVDFCLRFLGLDVSVDGHGLELVEQFLRVVHDCLVFRG